MKTYIVSAFWAFLFAYGVSAFAHENNVWVATDDRIALIAPDGTVISSVTSVFGRGFAYGIGFRIMDVDQSDGSLWVADDSNNRIFRLSRTGVPEIEIPLFSPLGISVDSRDGSVWTSVLVTPSNTRDVVKFDRNGQELVRISGFSRFISGISLDEVSESIWVSDRFNDQVVRLIGPDQELNGYDASGPSGSNHLRIGGFTEPMSISVNPNDDSQGAGNAWVANRFPGEVVKLSPTGTELVRKAPSLDGEVRLVEANPLEGSVWAMSRGIDAITHFSFAGDELISIPINLPQTFALNPGHEIVWVGSGFGFEAEAQVIKLDFSGTELFRFDESNTVRDIALQTQFIPVAIDIKPSSFPNSINPKSKGVIPVAILTTDTFDATTVDPGSVRFGPAEASAFRHKIKDVDRDGDRDLLLHFRTREMGIKCGDTSASLTGKTTSGQDIEGSDSIKTVGCK